MHPLCQTDPPQLSAIQLKTEDLGFSMPADLEVGTLLRTLAASKPGGRFLELGTGLGLSLSYLVMGMDTASTIVSIDNDVALTTFVAHLFAADERVTVITTDGARWIEAYTGPPFDLIFADTWPGKYDHLVETLALLSPGGLYVIDDMLEQPNWPDGHAGEATELLHYLSGRHDLYLTMLEWSSGVVIASRKGEADEAIKSP